MGKDQAQIKVPGIGEVQIKIPDTGEHTLSVEDVKKDADLKFKDINHILLTVVIVLLVMVATLIATVAGIVIGAYQNQAASYQNLVNQITAQNNIKGK